VERAHRAFENGKSLKSLGDTIQIAGAELILRTTVPRQFTNGQHPFDYCNVANTGCAPATTHTRRASFI